MGSQSSSLEHRTDRREHLILSGQRSEHAESFKSWKNCRKNQGHPMFISLGEFTLGHLPQKLRRNDVFELIKSTAALTVRLRVKHVSSDRPQEDYSPDSHGPCLGTGFIISAEQVSGKYSQTSGYERNSVEGQRMLWRLKIQTARHVVYDETEARLTAVELNFDDEASRTDGRMKRLSGSGELISTSRYGEDICVFSCVTDDNGLGKQIKSQLDQWMRLYRDLSINAPWSEIIWSKTVVIVSHPHGQAKQVTIGERTNTQSVLVDNVWWMGSYGWTCYSYTTATCSGSSGALVLRLGARWWDGLVWGGWWVAVHSEEGEKPGHNDGIWVWSESSSHDNKWSQLIWESREERSFRTGDQEALHHARI